MGIIVCIIFTNAVIINTNNNNIGSMLNNKLLNNNKLNNNVKLLWIITGRLIQRHCLIRR
jgi:hypothetical protein